MVREVRIYVEGGGNTKLSWRKIREGLSAFLNPLRELALQHGAELRIVPCGSRNDTFEEFRLALKNWPDIFNVLLVDSENQVLLTPREHLRQQDHWNFPAGTEDQCHLMVRTIEAWLVADPETLASYYGQGFRRNALPKHEDIEAVSKEQLYQSLDRATAGTQKGRYAKIQHCADLLGRLNRDRVRQRAAHCDLLFRTLEAQLGG